MLKKLGRALIIFLGAIAGGVLYYFILYFSDPSYREAKQLIRNNTDVSLFILCVFTMALIFNVVAPAVSRGTSKATADIGRDMAGVPVPKILTGVIGLIFGFVIALLLSMTYRSLLSSGWYTILTLLLYIVCGFLGFSIGVSKSNDLMQMAAKVRNDVSNRDRMRSHGGSGPKVFDTSSIIDGRIADVMRAGFLDGPYVIPDFVLAELHHISDSANSLKRTRGRRGLDILEQMQKEFKLSFYKSAGKKEIEEIPEVDVKLVKLCKMLKGSLVTTDYNLNKVAKINDVKVLNINELANAIKPVVLPGEKMIVDIIKQGKTPEQGIGYLDDGTMIVVEDGSGRIGETVTIHVTSAIQTSAGKMIFGRCGR